MVKLLKIKKISVAAYQSVVESKPGVKVAKTPVVQALKLKTNANKSLVVKSNNVSRPAASVEPVKRLSLKAIKLVK